MIDYPLLLDPLYDRKIWGGRRLETLLTKTLPAGEPIGESLESGDDAIVANGPLAGSTLRDLVKRDPLALLGVRGLAASQPYGNFPLLVKFIDATDILSLQLHPDDEAAAALGKRGKTEAWYVVHADPGAMLITGMSRAAGGSEVRTSIADGTFEAFLERRLVSASDSLIVPAGTMHAIGAGVLLYEVQENSDITFRLYDWGRLDDQGQPRELHLEQALDSLHPDRHARITEPLRRDEWREVLSACRYFSLERWQISGIQTLSGSGGDTFRLLSCIEGSFQIGYNRSGVVDIGLGWTVLLPANMPDVILNGAATILCSSIDDLVDDIARPLLAAGHAATSIVGLGGDTDDMARALASIGYGPSR